MAKAGRKILYTGRLHQALALRWQTILYNGRDQSHVTNL